MSRLILAVAFLFMSLLGIGCGTVCNLAVPEGEYRVFGGVRFDAKMIPKFADGATSNSQNTGNYSNATGAIFLIVLPFLDMPLSFIGDIITFPIAFWLDSRK